MPLYTNHGRAAVARWDFEISLRDREQIAATLDAYWANGPLSGLGRRIAALSRRPQRAGEVGYIIVHL